MNRTRLDRIVYDLNPLERETQGKYAQSRAVFRKK